MIIETIIYFALIIALFSVCDNSLSRRYYVPLKVVCSASFLVILWINQCFSEKLWLLFWALLACFVGDLLMGLFNTYMRKRFIAIGIIAFMLGHVALLNYMCRITDDTGIWVYILPVAVCGLMVAMKKYYHDKVLLPPKFFSQSTMEKVTGVYVPLEETLRGFKAILDGEMDEYPETAFFNVGTIDDVKRKASEMKTQEE